MQYNDYGVSVRIALFRDCQTVNLSTPVFEGSNPSSTISQTLVTS